MNKINNFYWAVSIVWIGLLSPLASFSQQRVTEDFSDGDFTSNPMWTGTAENFIIASGRLQLDVPEEAGEAYLSLGCDLIDNTEWGFSITLNFNPSSANYARVYLVSDSPDLSGPLNGYFVMIGGTPDEISLYRQTGTTRTLIIDGIDDRVDLSSVEARIKVTRDDQGNWSLLSDVGLSGEYTLEGSTQDQSHITSTYFGVDYHYTKTRSDKFYFDDLIIEGEPYVDVSTPANVSDVIITEIFADPLPQVELPDGEYVEIYNRSEKTIQLRGWTFSDAASSVVLPSHSFPPDSYLILAASSLEDQFSVYGDVLGLSGFPVLNNTGDSLRLKTAGGTVIDSVFYTDDWYKDDDKDQGGWSLERIDIHPICTSADNWVASEDDRGGTPDQTNSVNANKPDVSGPMLLTALALTPTYVRLTFSEALVEESLAIATFTFSPTVTVKGSSFTDLTRKNVDVEMLDALQEGILYTLQVDHVKDCSGNLIQEDNKTITLSLPEEAKWHDVVINEILFNPYPQGVDFVEIYNRSSKYINLKNWVAGNASGDYHTITEEDILIAPDDFKVLTQDPGILISHYPRGNFPSFIKLSLPSLPDDGGAVWISNDIRMVDSVSFNKSWHSPLIDNEEGVSLERIEVSAESNDPQNWRSAATSVGYATPGYKNSNTQLEIITDAAVRVEPEIFEPVYGNPEFSRIHYQFERGGYIANVRIYDTRGRLIKVLANNEILATNGFYRWDGDCDDGSRARIGYYVVWFELFDEQNMVKTFRKRVVVASQFR